MCRPPTEAASQPTLKRTVAGWKAPRMRRERALAMRRTSYLHRRGPRELRPSLRRLAIARPCRARRLGCRARQDEAGADRQAVPEREERVRGQRHRSTRSHTPKHARVRCVLEHRSAA